MKKFYCYSKYLFDMLMEKSGFFNPNDLPHNVAIISIGAPWNEQEDHWFKTTNDRVLNIDFDDVSPELWWNDDMYDEAMNDDKQAKYFDYSYINSRGNVTKLHALDYNQARAIVNFIEENRNCDFYIHCSAGVSRSQGVVRYALDTYGDYKTNPDNPCVCPNVHVTRMLKRVYREKYNSAFIDESCKWDYDYKFKKRIIRYV